jgi:hypothetical protein
MYPPPYVTSDSARIGPLRMSARLMMTPGSSGLASNPAPKSRAVKRSQAATAMMLTNPTVAIGPLRRGIRRG